MALFKGQRSLPSFIRTSWRKISPAGEPRSALGTGSATGRTRQRSWFKTAVTAAALVATQRPSASSR